MSCEHHKPVVRHWRFSPAYQLPSHRVSLLGGVRRRHWLPGPAGQRVRAARGCGVAQARLNMEGMENIGFKARSACGWGLRREALKVGTQRDALWQRKLCGLVWQPAGLAWQACYVDGNLK